MIASKVMSKNPVTISEGMTVKHAIELLRTHRVHDLPVVNAEGKPVGMITARAILHAAVPAYVCDELLKTMLAGPDIPSVYEHLLKIADMGVSSVMVTDAIIVTADTATSAVAAQLVNMSGDIQNIMIVDEKERLVGTISALDIVSRMPA